MYVDALVLRDRDTDGNAGNGLEERLWVQQDANWNVTALVDGSGTVQERFTYDPVGVSQVRDASWAVKSGGSDHAWVYRHQGLRLDPATGLYYARHREYHPVLGRWLQVDPIGYSSKDNNLYRFAVNNPIIWVDPVGLQPGAPYLPSPYEPGGPRYMPRKPGMSTTRRAFGNASFANIRVRDGGLDRVLTTATSQQILDNADEAIRRITTVNHLVVHCMEGIRKTVDELYDGVID